MAEPELNPNTLNNDTQNNLHTECVQNANGSSNSQLLNSSNANNANPTTANLGQERSNIPLLPNNNSNNSNPNSIKNMQAPTEIITRSITGSTENDNTTQSFV